MKFRSSLSHTTRAALLGTVLLAGGVLAQPALADPSFANFDKRARAGERLTVAFFGASLTWGANASDPQQTSYRANVAKRFQKAYPNAHFTFVDGAIGGTGSQLGVFRLDRDVLNKKPDLVFLDFSANDDIYSDNPESLASYESLVRRVVDKAKLPLVQVIFPFQWNVKPGELAKMKRRDAHRNISGAYKTGLGDAVLLANQRVEKGETTLANIWPIDGVHPGDNGYALFTDAAWSGYQDAVTRNVATKAPAKMLYADTYMNYKRVRLSTLGPLPQGWRVGIPYRVSAWFDGLMSRWLDDVTIVSNRIQKVSPEGKKSMETQEYGPLKVQFKGSMVMLFGESSLKSGNYRAIIDGKAVTNPRPTDATQPELFSANSSRMGGNLQHVNVLASGLDANVTHTLEIVPVFDSAAENELRIESICVAGPGADVLPAK